MPAITPDRLRNWARWLRYWSGGFGGRCASLEGGWRSPQQWYEVTNPRPAQPDAVDAWDIEVACRILPIRYHLALKLYHVQLYNYSDIAEEFRKSLGERIYARDIPGTLGMATGLLEQALHLPAVVRMTRAQAHVRHILCQKPLTTLQVGL